MIKKINPNLDNESAIKELTKLQESEELFRSTFEQAAVGIAHVGTNGNFIRINQKFCDIVGYSKQEMCKLTFQDITHPDDLAADLKNVQQLIKQDIDVYTIEKRYLQKNKKIVWVHLTVSLIRNETGDPKYFIALVQDISEHKEAEDLLGKSQAIAHIGNWSIKRGEEEVVLSDEVRRIFGLPFGSACTVKMFNEIIHPDDIDSVKSSWMTSLNHEQFDFTYRILVDGQLKWVAVKAEAVFQKEDETFSAVGTVQDITEQKKAEQALALEENKFELLVAQAGDAFFILDYEGTIIDINQQACQSLGYSRRELLKMTIPQVDIEFVDMEHRSQFWDPLKTGEYINFEGIHRRKDGSTFPVEIRLGRFDIKDRKLLLALSRDITDRKKKEQALKKEAEFQKLVSKISTRFINLPADKIDQAINEQFVEIGNFFNADRVTIGQLSEKGEVLAATHMWFSDKVNAEKLATDTMGATYPNLVNHIKDQEYWSFSDPDDFYHWHPERETIEKTDFKSGLVINTSFEKSIMEIFVIDFVHSYVWTQSTIDKVELLGNVFSNALKRKHAEQALKQEEDKFELLVKQAGDAFFILDFEGEISDINPQACRSLGYSREELLGMDISEIDIKVGGKQIRHTLWDQLKEAGKHITFEGAHRRKDGSSFPVEVRVGRLDIGKKKYMLALARDITDRKKKELAFIKEVEFKQLVSRISTKFIGLSGVEFENAIKDAFKEIGIYFGVDVVRLYQLSVQGEVLKLKHMWRSEHLAPVEQLPEIQKMRVPKLAALYSRGESVLFNKLDDSPQWQELSKILKISGAKAAVGVPLEYDNSGIDIFAMEKVLSEYVWPEDIIEQSNAIGKVILSAMRRGEAEVELQNRYKEITQLKNQLEQENIYLQEEINVNHNFEEIIGQSSSLNFVLHRVEQVAPTDATVLIQGETGTGKELFAHALHSLSLRKHKPLIKVGCASLSSNLIESEFFGHEKGAFTGADKQRIGRFELANNGTIFLDEIGELSIELQSKLLRVLQEGEFERLGSSKTIKVNVRVIAATNRILEEEVKKGNFKEDLYYRLNSFLITIPPLRERHDDIPVLVKFLANKLSKKLNKKINTIRKAHMRNLESYSWPGNIRELENVIENAIITSDNGVLNFELPESRGLTDKNTKKLQDIEHDHIFKVLESTNWRIGGKGGAAEKLGLKRTTLQGKMKKYGIKRHS